MSNGREALERWRAACWDLLLIDLQMPEMDGETAIRLLRKRPTRWAGNISPRLP